MFDNKIKVYVKIDDNNVITEINSSIFLSNVEGYIMIDEGNGDKYAHAQGNYLPNGLMDNQGRHNYKYVDGQMIELSEDEKSSLFPSNPTPPNINADTNDEITNIMEGMVNLTQRVDEMSNDNGDKADIMEALINLSDRLDKIESSLNK